MFKFFRAWRQESFQVHSKYARKLAFLVVQEMQWGLLEMANKMPHRHAEIIASKAPEVMEDTVDTLFKEAIGE